jgi:integrase
MVNTSHLRRCPYKGLTEAQRIFDWATINLKPDPARRFIQGMRVKLIDHNPFAGMSSEIRIKKTSTEDNDIDPFTKAEREAIIQAFAHDRYYSHYTNYVRFLFYTGCRPSEAVALQWKHISTRDIMFEQAVVKSSRGLVLKQGLKTQANRKFPINAQLKDFLETLKPQDASPDTFIFPGPRRRFIDLHNFRNRAWARVLSALDFRHRKPCQSRHTFITLCLEAGISAQQVAKWVGNTPEVIMKHYAGTIAQAQVPEV